MNKHYYLRNKDRDSGQAALNMMPCVLVVTLLLTILVGMVFLLWHRDDSLQNSTWGERVWMSKAVDPDLPSDENVVLSDSYNCCATIYSSDGGMLQGPLIMPDEAFFNLVGNGRGRYLSTVLQRKATEDSRFGLIRGLQGEEPSYTLTLDSPLQHELTNYMTAGGVKGTCTLIDADSGCVEVMVSTPAAVPGGEGSSVDGALTSACLGQAIPGSIMKVVALYTAYAEGLNPETMEFYCDGAYQLPSGDTVYCTGHHGKQDIYAALGHSCNVYFAQLIEELSPEKTLPVLQSLGFNVNGQPGTVLMSDDPLWRILPSQTGRVTFTNSHDFSSVWSLLGEGEVSVNPVRMAWLLGCLGEDRVLPLPHVLEDSQSIVAEVEFSSPAMEATARVWHQAYQSYYGSEYDAHIRVAKTGTAETGDKKLQKRLSGVLQGSDGRDRIFLVTVDNFSECNVLPLDVVNHMSQLL